jgi:proteic killer suppression protein
MIVSFKHKGLKVFFETGSTRGIQAKHAVKLQDILDLLDAAECVDDMNAPGYMLHLLEPRKNNIYSVRVSGNWRVTFRMIGNKAEIVDYLDYH